MGLSMYGPTQYAHVPMEILFTCPPSRSIERRIHDRRDFAFLTGFFAGFALALAFALGLGLGFAFGLDFAITFFAAGFVFATAFRDGLAAGRAGAATTGGGAFFAGAEPYFLFSRSHAFFASAVPGHASGQKHRSIVHQSCFTPELAFSCSSTGPKSTLPVKNGLWVDVWSSWSEPSESISWTWLIFPRNFLAKPSTPPSTVSCGPPVCLAPTTPTVYAWQVSNIAPKFGSSISLMIRRMSL